MFTKIPGHMIFSCQGRRKRVTESPIELANFCPCALAQREVAVVV
jgi:hypothetical protein